MLLLAVLAIGGCSSEDELTTYSNRIWNVTGTGQKDADPELTRGMSIGGDAGKTLYFNWDGDEQIAVINAAGQSVGPLSVTVNPSNTALVDINGQITGTYAVGDKVTYYVPSVEMDLTGQKGTIADLSKNFSYLTATSVTVEEVDANRNAITMSGAAFTRRPAILRLRLTDSEGNRLKVKELKISCTSGKLVKSIAADGTKAYYDFDAGDEFAMRPEKEDGAYPKEFFIALLNDYNDKDTYTFSAWVGNSVYSSTTDEQKISAKLVGGKYYNAVRKMTKIVDGDVETTGDLKITFNSPDPLYYTGSELTPGVTVKYNNSDVNSSDYDLHYFENINVGRAFVVAIGKTGTTVADKAGVTTFTILKATPTITLTTTEMTLAPGGTQTRTATTTFGTVTYASSNESVAIVDATGKVTAVADGTATITASVAADVNGNWNAATVQYTITVDTSVVDIMGNAPAGCQLVDLGLPSGTKWANMNVGATSESDCGDYFAWGETEPYYISLNPLTWKTGKSAGYAIDWSCYKWTTDGGSSFTKYTGSNNATLEAADDAATHKWGGSWRMPTATECQELIDNTIQTWETINGVAGTKFTSRMAGYTDKYIFLPATGEYVGTSLNGAGSYASYWLSSLDTSSASWGQYLSFYSSSAYVGSHSRSDGYTVRPVLGGTTVSSNSGGSFSGNPTTENL